MSTFNVHSEEFQRSMAVNHLKEHKREKRFQVNTSVSQTTLDEFKVRGCEVVLESAAGLYTISSPVPFGELVTSAEWKQNRLELLHGIGLFILTKGGYIGVIALAVSLNMGFLTAAIWFWAWLFLGGAAFPDSERREKITGVIIGLLLFGAGIAAKLLGWSGKD